MTNEIENSRIKLSTALIILAACFGAIATAGFYAGGKLNSIESGLVDHKNQLDGLAASVHQVANDQKLISDTSIAYQARMDASHAEDSVHLAKIDTLLQIQATEVPHVVEDKFQELRIRINQLQDQLDNQTNPAARINRPNRQGEVIPHSEN